MRDLVRLTGVGAPTIHFYAQQGLLPEHRKTAGNQARYPESTVGRLSWIRSLQDELRLPLRSIRWVLERWGELPISEIRTAQALGTLLEAPDPAAAGEDVDHLAARLGPDDLDELRRLGLIGAAGPPSRGDVRLLELVAALRQAGFTAAAGFDIANLALYRDAVERLVEDELSRVVEPVLARLDAEALHELVQQGLPLANQLLALLHERAVQGELRRWLELPHDPTGQATA
ncbi:MAG: MerR family transcriptional regulator [Candidatus Dormibacteria bacterium]